MTDGELEDILLDGASVLERDALLIRDSFQRNIDAADPIPGVEKQRRLVAELRAIAALKPTERRVRLQGLAGSCTLIDRVAKGWSAASVDRPPSERIAVDAAARSLRLLSDTIRAI